MNDKDFRLIAITGKLAGYRKAANLTQEDMAKKLGITTATYNKKENNPDLFTYAEQVKIEEVLRSYLKDMPAIF